MKLKRAGSILLALMMVMIFPFSASAEEWKSDDFSITIPDDLYVFTEETPLSDSSWLVAGVTDPTSVLTLFKSTQDKGMNAVLNLIGENGTPNILVTKKSSQESWDVFNFSELTEEKQQEFLETLGGDLEDFSFDSAIVKKGDISFLSMQYDSLDSFKENSDVGEMHELVYATIFNGYMVTFNLQAQGRALTDEELATLGEIAFSLQITNPITKEEAEAANTVSPEEIRNTFLMLGGFVLLIVAAVVFFKVRSKKEKQQKKEMADRLSAYRKANPGSSEIKGEMLYANLSDCSNEVLHTFSIYHAYIKNIPALAVGILLSIALIIMTVLTKSEWWMIVAAIALFIYQGYKIITASSTVERIQRKVYGQNNNKRGARYTFYDSAFRVAGIQSAMAYPYFHLTDVRRYKGFIYLYYGPDNTYIVSEDGFEKGDKDDFYQFIKAKIAEK